MFFCAKFRNKCPWFDLLPDVSISLSFTINFWRCFCDHFDSPFHHLGMAWKIFNSKRNFNDISYFFIRQFLGQRWFIELLICEILLALFYDFKTAEFVGSCFLLCYKFEHCQMNLPTLTLPVFTYLTFYEPIRTLLFPNFINQWNERILHLCDLRCIYKLFWSCSN